MPLPAGFRTAVRRVRRTPHFTVFAVAFLALVIVVAALVYSAVRSAASLPSGLAAPQQPRPLPEPLRAHLQEERMDAVTSIRGLPLGVRDALQKLFDSQTLDIADPGAEFKATGEAGQPSVPSRRLVAAGCSMDHCLVYYERGGSPHTWQVALFQWTPAGTSFEWGAAAPGDMRNIDDVRSGVLSGAINRPTSVW